jgi:hypothetical protein
LDATSIVVGAAVGDVKHATESAHHEIFVCDFSGNTVKVFDDDARTGAFVAF